jgi:hypothetical protein
MSVPRRDVRDVAAVLHLVRAEAEIDQLRRAGRVEAANLSVTMR